MSFIIREGEKEDMPSVLKLIKELAHFEKESNAVILPSLILKLICYVLIMC